MSMMGSSQGQDPRPSSYTPRDQRSRRASCSRATGSGRNHQRTRIRTLASPAAISCAN